VMMEEATTILGAAAVPDESDLALLMPCSLLPCTTRGGRANRTPRSGSQPGWPRQGDTGPPTNAPVRVASRHEKGRETRT
jgi:hypothetical protein